MRRLARADGAAVEELRFPTPKAPCTGETPQASGILLGVTIAIICIAPAVGLCHAARVAFEPAQSSVPGSRDTHQALEIIQRRTGLLEEHLDRLRAIPAHGNRTLHIDQLFIGLLLAFFDPLARSLRTVADNGNFDGRLDIKRLARSTMSDALAVFDPAHLQPIINDLRALVPHLKQTDLDLASITRRIIAADGTYLTLLSDIAWALRHTKSDGKTQCQVRANVQLDTATWTPQVVTISGDDGISEPMSFAPDLLSGVLYVIDRGFLEFDFIRRLEEKNNQFVLRVRANAPAARVIETRVLCARDLEQGVIADEMVQLTGRDAPAGVYRRVTIQTSDRHGKPQLIILLTNLCDTDIAAYVIGAIYRLRAWNRRRCDPLPIVHALPWLIGTHSRKLAISRTPVASRPCRRRGSTCSARYAMATIRGTGGPPVPRIVAIAYRALHVLPRRRHGRDATGVRDMASLREWVPMSQGRAWTIGRGSQRRRFHARMRRRRPPERAQFSRGGVRDVFARPLSSLPGVVHLPFTVAIGDHRHRLLQRALAAGQAPQRRQGIDAHAAARLHV